MIGKVRKCFRWIETYVVSDNYFRSISCLPPAPYPECQPSQTALEQNSLEYLTSLAQLEVNSVNSLLEQHEMYHDGNTMPTTLTLPTLHSLTTPVNMTSGFQTIGGMPSITQTTQSAQVSHTQTMNILESQSTTGSAVHRLTPVNVTDQHLSPMQPLHKHSLLHWLVLCPLHRSGWTLLSL